MARDKKTAKIKDREYDFYPLSPKASVRMFTRLTKTFGEAVVRLMAAGGNGAGGEASLDLKKIKTDAIHRSESLARAARALIERLDEDQVYDTIEEMLKSVHVKGKGDNGTRPINIEKDFTGAVAEMALVFIEAVKVEYGDFFDELIGLVDRPMTAAEV